MSPEKLRLYQEKLQALAAELRQSLEEGKDDSAPVALDTSIGRLSRMDAMQSQQMALALKQRQQNQLARVKKALDAVDHGTYGDCRKCGNPIAEDRLEVQPDAVLCVTCASAVRTG
jgi:DnaK suppressor protein